MSSYVSEIQHAVSQTMKAVWADHDRLTALEQEQNALKKEMEDSYNQVDSLRMNAEDPDDDGLATGLYWDTYFGVDKQHHKIARQKDNLASLIAVRAFSRNAQSAALCNTPSRVFRLSITISSTLSRFLIALLAGRLEASVCVK